MKSTERALARLQRAAQRLIAHRALAPVCQDIAPRIERASGPAYEPLTLAGLVRTLESYLSAEVHEEKPDWTQVRRIHAAWVAARAYEKARREDHGTDASGR